MTLQAIELRNVWGVDTTLKFARESAGALASARIPKALDATEPPIRVVARYVSLGPQAHGDLDPAELAALHDGGFAVYAVQHCRSGEWEASGMQGASDGAWAARNAAGAGLPTGEGIALALDLESVSNVGQPVIDHVTEWCRQAALGGFEPAVYVGFRCGLSPDQLYEIPTVRRYWSDYGPRVVSVRGFCAQQHPQTTIGGAIVDPDWFSEDYQGGTLVAWGPWVA